MLPAPSMATDGFASAVSKTGLVVTVSIVPQSPAAVRVEAHSPVALSRKITTAMPAALIATRGLM